MKFLHPPSLRPRFWRSPTKQQVVRTWHGIRALEAANGGHALSPDQLLFTAHDLLQALVSAEVVRTHHDIISTPTSAASSAGTPSSRHSRVTKTRRSRRRRASVAVDLSRSPLAAQLPPPHAAQHAAFPSAVDTPSPSSSRADDATTNMLMSVSRTPTGRTRRGSRVADAAVLAGKSAFRTPPASRARRRRRASIGGALPHRGRRGRRASTGAVGIRQHLTRGRLDASDAALADIRDTLLALHGNSVAADPSPEESSGVEAAGTASEGGLSDGEAEAAGVGVDTGAEGVQRDVFAVASKIGSPVRIRLPTKRQSSLRTFGTNAYESAPHKCTDTNPDGGLPLSRFIQSDEAPRGVDGDGS